MDSHHRLMFVVCLAVSILLVETIGQCPEGHFLCDKGRCISSERVCNGQIDCRDQSDETGCEGDCPEDNFTCDDGRCLSADRVCNGKFDCRDQTDEMQCESAADSDEIIVKAANYLWDQRFDFGEFAPRALVALSMAEKVIQMPEKEKLALANFHNRELLLLLKEGVDTVPLHVLSWHINALYAMCTDPRNFHGINLIDLLRFQTDKAMASSNFNMPGVLLTLCLAKSSRFEDFQLLVKLYDKKIQTTAAKALVLLAMATCNRQVETYEYKIRVKDFINKLQLDYSRSIGSYAVGLIIQAHNAWGYSSPWRNYLRTLQLDDGSFQDVLGTYAAIPALLNSSLADLKCKKLSHEETAPGRSNTIEVFSPRRNVDLSISIENGDNIGRHTLRLTFEGRKSLAQLLQAAELQNSMFKFEVDGIVKKVTSLAGRSNDAESGITWHLFKAIDQKSTKDVVELADIDSIFPEDDDHYIFQMQ